MANISFKFSTLKNSKKFESWIWHDLDTCPLCYHKIHQTQSTWGHTTTFSPIGPVIWHCIIKKIPKSKEFRGCTWFNINTSTLLISSIWLLSLSYFLLTHMFFLSNRDYIHGNLLKAETGLSCKPNTKQKNFCKFSGTIVNPDKMSRGRFQHSHAGSCWDSAASSYWAAHNCPANDDTRCAGVGGLPAAAPTTQQSVVWSYLICRVNLEIYKRGRYIFENWSGNSSNKNMLTLTLWSLKSDKHSIIAEISRTHICGYALLKNFFHFHMIIL